MKRPLILIVDDDVLGLQLASALLVRHGVECVTASSGTQAISLLRSQSVDAVISDLHMGGMDGLQLLGTVRAMKELSGLPVAIVTADLCLADSTAAAIGALGATLSCGVLFEDDLLALARRLLRPT